MLPLCPALGGNSVGAGVGGKRREKPWRRPLSNRRCFNFELPSAKSFADDLDLVEMAIDGDSAQFLHHVYVFQCDAGLKFPRAAALEPYMCMSHSGSLLASCNALWWGVVQPELCAPPGLVLANLGALRRAGKNIVVQVRGRPWG